MVDLSITVDGLKLPNPFVIGSGPPGTNANVIGRAFDEGWGAVVAKTISLDASKVINVAPRYARVRAAGTREVIGWENIELISDLRIFHEEFFDILPPLTQSFSLIGVPGSGLFDKPVFHAAVDQISLSGDPLSIDNIELSETEGRSHFVFYDFNFDPVANDILSIF